MHFFIILTKGINSDLLKYHLVSNSDFYINRTAENHQISMWALFAALQEAVYRDFSKLYLGYFLLPEAISIFIFPGELALRQKPTYQGWAERDLWALCCN